MLEYCELFVQNVVLWTHSDLVMQVASVQAKVLLLENHAARCRLEQANYHLDRGGLACSVVA